MNPIAAKVYFYYARVHELLGGKGKEYGEIRPVLLAAYRTASLQHANECQVDIFNIYIDYQECNVIGLLYLSDRYNFNGSVSNNQLARYLYYLGRIKAVQLEYDVAFAYLEESLRKAPRNTALGFR